MMKTKLFLALAAGLMVASCAQKEDLGVDTIAKADETRYLKVSLCNPSAATKAPDFEEGAEAENAVESLYFMFYDKNGNPLGNPVIVDPDGLTWKDNTGNVEKFATSVVPVEVVKGQEVPAYVVCLLNAGDEISTDRSYTMDQLRSTTRSSVQNPVNESNVQTFPMVNSVYYGADPFYGPNYRMFGTPIEISQLHSSPTTAAAAQAVDIYVERFAAKVSLTLPAAANIEAVSVDNDAYTLQFTPVAWGINADESNTYVAKRFATSDAADAVAPSYADINTALGNWWNDATNYRSYWACSPSYYATAFPRVSDDIRDNYKGTSDETPNGSGALVGDYKLKYYSYNQFSENEIAAGETKTLYVSENTASESAFISENPKASVSSVVIIGKYTVTPKDAAALPANTTFYLYGGENKLYFAHNSGITGGKSILETMVANQAILATNQTGTLLKVADLATNPTVVAALDVNHPAKSVRKDQVVPARFVTLQVKDAANNPFYYLDREAADGPVWTKVDATNIDRVNALLMQSVAFARAFYEGCCYFSIPIEHLGYGVQNGNDGKHYNEDGFEWTKVKRGAFGLVRNHSYNIKVTGISGLATGLHGTDNPIVPPMDSDEYFVAYRLNILSWAVVPPQNVNLN